MNTVYTSQQPNVQNIYYYYDPNTGATISMVEFQDSNSFNFLNNTPRINGVLYTCICNTGSAPGVGLAIFLDDANNLELVCTSGPDFNGATVNYSLSSQPSGDTNQNFIATTIPGAEAYAMGNSTLQLTIGGRKVSQQQVTIHLMGGGGPIIKPQLTLLQKFLYWVGFKSLFNISVPKRGE